MSRDPILLDGEDFAQLNTEVNLRPSSEGVIQLEMEDLETYHVYEYPSKVTDFSDPDKLEIYLQKAVVHEDSDRLVRTGIAFMTNYGLSNIDIKEGKTYMVSRRNPTRMRSF